MLISSWGDFDGSDDGTESLICERYKDIIYYYQDNSGLSAARNKGLEIAIGDYIQFLDADDIIPINKVENHIKFLNQNVEVDIVYSHCKKFIEENQNDKIDWYDKKLYSNGNIFTSLLKKSFILPHMPLSRKSVLMNFNGRFPIRSGLELRSIFL